MQVAKGKRFIVHPDSTFVNNVEILKGVMVSGYVRVLAMLPRLRESKVAYPV